MMPDLKPFTASKNESFESFVRLFDAKYDEKLWSSKIREVVFVNLLKDGALEIFRSFPTEIQKGNLNHLILTFKITLEEMKDLKH